MRASSRSSGTRPAVAPPPELVTSTLSLLPAISGGGATTTPLFGATPQKPISELHWARRQVSRLERENAHLSEANSCLCETNKRLKTANSELQNENASLQSQNSQLQLKLSTAAEARLQHFRQLDATDKLLEQAKTQAATAAHQAAQLQAALNSAEVASAELQRDLDESRSVVRSVCLVREDSFASSLKDATQRTRRALGHSRPTQSQPASAPHAVMPPLSTATAQLEHADALGASHQWSTEASTTGGTYLERGLVLPTRRPSRCDSTDENNSSSTARAGLEHHQAGRGRMCRAAGVGHQSAADCPPHARAEATETSAQIATYDR